MCFLVDNQAGKPLSIEQQPSGNLVGLIRESSNENDQVNSIAQICFEIINLLAQSASDFDEVTFYSYQKNGQTNDYSLKVCRPRRTSIHLLRQHKMGATANRRRTLRFVFYRCKKDKLLRTNW